MKSHAGGASASTPASSRELTRFIVTSTTSSLDPDTDNPLNISTSAQHPPRYFIWRDILDLEILLRSISNLF